MNYSNHSLSLETILIFAENKMQQLLQVLNRETSILEDNDLKELESITLEKISLSVQIEKNEQQRIHFLTAKLLNPSEPSQWLENNKLISLWLDIKKLSDKAQKQNQINGHIINGNRRRLQTQIEKLSASSPAAKLIYSAESKNIIQPDSNTLAHV